MRKPPDKGVAKNVRKFIQFQEVPWQIWVVVVALGLEGIKNFLSIPQQPMALIWLVAKCIFILGLLKGWKCVFCLFVVIGGLHVLYFMLQSPLVTLINLVLVSFVLWSYHFYFPREALK